MDIQWRWTLLIFTASFVLSWLAFAVLWWLIAFTHGDLEPDHLPGNFISTNVVYYYYFFFCVCVYSRNLISCCANLQTPCDIRHRWWRHCLFCILLDNQAASGWKPCVGNIHGFASTFLFSIETQHTIGYGYRYTTEECPEGLFVMCIQSIIGVMIQVWRTIYRLS